MTKRTAAPPERPSPVRAFTPVPRKCRRHDGWTRARQRAFIQALAETGSVSAAAQRVGMSSEGAYALRAHPEAGSFRAAWEAALDAGVRSLTDLAIERARNGIAIPIFHRGEQVGEKRWYNDRLLMFVLRHHLPDRYGLTLGGGTRSRETIEREAAENCPTCHAAREAAEEAASNESAEAWLDEILRRYLNKVDQEADERRAGRWYAADFYLRQLTHMELILAVGGRSQQMIDTLTANPDRYGGLLHADDVSTILAEKRAILWAARDDPPRPPQRLARTLTCSSIRGGPDQDARYRARADCERRIAAARDEWEATRTPESWGAWCDGR